MLDAVLAEARGRGRTSFGSDAWDADGHAAFAATHGFEPKSRAINRRQVLADVDFADLARRYGEALGLAADYELVRRVGATPDDELDAVAEMTAAINDAPTDDLDIEDEAFPPERIRAYESAQESRGHRLYRVLARHRGTGELAGHSVVVVDGERPELAEQHDTSVLGTHRGHRLGLLLKADMNLWLREAEPQLVSVDTWNAESNAHMIGVNELLGYRVLGREIEYQRQRPEVTSAGRAAPWRGPVQNSAASLCCGARPRRRRSRSVRWWRRRSRSRRPRRWSSSGAVR